MNTDEMIAVMQAYARGEAIEVSDKGAGNWSEIKCPLWDWNSFEYRVRPKNRKFEEGDKVIEKDAQMLMLDENNGYIWTVKGYTEDGGIEFKGGAIIPEHQVCEEYVKIDDALWYWEYQDADGHWEKSDYRATRAEIEKLSNFHNFSPLYALGFRVKDTK